MNHSSGDDTWDYNDFGTSPPTAPGPGLSADYPNPQSIIDLSEVPSVAQVTMSSAPWKWLLAATGFLVASLGLIFFADAGPWVSLTGWVFGGLGSVGLVAVFLLADARRRSRQYLPPPGIDWWRRAILVGAAVAVTAHAWAFAGFAARHWAIW